MPRARVTVVCLHGLRRTPCDWAVVASALARSWDVRIPALPARPSEALDAADEAIAPGDVVFAHSMGAVVALRLLRQRPRPLSALVLTSAFFPPSRDDRTLAAAVHGHPPRGTRRGCAARSATPRSGTSRSVGGSFALA